MPAKKKDTKAEAVAEEKAVDNAVDVNSELNDEFEPEQDFSDRFTVTVPNTLTKEAWNRLIFLISSKKHLLMKALDAEDLPVENYGDKLEFPWFKLQGIEGEAVAYSQLVSALIKMASESQRINPEEKPVENEKFTMRIFTVRLGLKGDECKLIRKLLLQNLSGNSAWRSGTPPKKATDKQNEENQSSSNEETEGGSTL